MSADKKKLELRAALAGKTTQELEELLALDFTDQENAAVDADYINAILEVIEERSNYLEKQSDLESAWKDFQELHTLRKQEASPTADTTEEPSHDHPRKTEYGQNPRKRPHAFRYAIIAAAVIALLCSTALGWNLFQAIADWTAETFHFLTGEERSLPQHDVFKYLRLSVQENTDIASVPNWSPKGTQQVGEVNVVDRKDRRTVHALFDADGREFTIQVIIHDSIPEQYSITYQKDASIEEEYEAGGITHYIVGNHDTLSAMWTNDCVEGHIQGALTLEEMRQMIDSIY